VHDAVRPLTSDDIPAVVALEAEARTALLDQRGGPAHLDEEPPADWGAAIGRAWVGTLDDVVLGYLELIYHGTAARVRQVFVHPEARELGLGDALLAAALEAARAAGCTVLERQRPVQFGGRFSMKAVRPSLVSCDDITSANSLLVRFFSVESSS